MEHDDHHLDSFSSSVIEYFNEVLIHKNCVSSTFRKYSVKNNEDVEFSFFLLRSTCDDRKSFCRIDSSCLTEEEAKKLIKFSERWRLRLANVSVEGHKLCLKLDRAHACRAVIKTILTRKSDYGNRFPKNQTIKITSDAPESNDLTEYRLAALRAAAENLLQAGGYTLGEAVDGWIHFTTKNFGPESETGAKLKLLCGPVVNSATRMKESEISSKEYRKLRLRDISAMAETRNVLSNQLDSLVDASIKISLLQVKSSQAVSLNLDRGHTEPREMGNTKRGAFLQYNAARLAALRRKYKERSAEGVYPEIGKPEEVNFDLVNEPEEWALVFNFLLEYPSVIYRISKEMAFGRSNIHQICDFLSKLCSLFSVYYRRVRILLEPKEHLLQTIQARMLLAMSVEQVLENGLAILGISKIEHM